jgi:hypothetical protein
MGLNNRTAVPLLFVLVAITLIISVFTYYNSQVYNKAVTPVGLDKFGINEIYETKFGGREWFINMKNFTDDYLFSKTFVVNITRQQDGGWLI